MRGSAKIAKDAKTVDPRKTPAIAGRIAGIAGMLFCLSCNRAETLTKAVVMKDNSTAAVMRRHTNRLIGEKSPYLLQHAHNPVDWFPWGEEAFERARRENKPIFLSVGYSTCHWCHVMARESFENEEIAGILNTYFVAIKVDREERPDVDKVYMTYVQAATGGGGWPMSVWLTPDLKPFMGGTYYPPDDRWGRPGFKNVLLQIANAWKQDAAHIVASSEEVLGKLRQAAEAPAAAGPGMERSLLDRAYRAIKRSYEPRYGGFGGAPKFPRPSAPDFMLRYYARTGTEDARDMALFTLRKMADGGIHDHIGGGFHRYSVDERWHVPHFEKMLYDQAQLANTYLDAYQIARDPFFADVARGILDYVRRDMTGAEGQFYSAEDADSDVPGRPGKHAEGAFYVWTQSETFAVLGEQDAAVFNYRYGVAENGNVRDDPHGEFPGKNVLIVTHTLGETARRFAMSEDMARSVLAEARRRLFEARAQRPRPHVDDKTIAAWNGLMISAFARAYQVLGEEGDLASAKAAANFIRRQLYDAKRGVLLRRYRKGEAGIEGYLDDYAFTIQGLLDLYEACFDVDYLTWAIALQKKQDALFWDADAGGYFSTTGKDGTILLRMKEDYDGAEPSPNSVALLNLSRLAKMTDRAEYSQKADKTLAAFSRVLTTAPHAMPRMIAAFDFRLDKPRQIVIAGNPDAPDTRAMIRAVHERFIPNKILLLADGGVGQKTLALLNEFIGSVARIDGKATAYVCENHVCQLPTTDLEEMKRLLETQGYAGIRPREADIRQGKEVEVREK